MAEYVNWSSPAGKSMISSRGGNRQSVGSTPTAPRPSCTGTGRTGTAVATSAGNCINDPAETTTSRAGAIDPTAHERRTITVIRTAAAPRTTGNAIRAKETLFNWARPGGTSGSDPKMALVARDPIHCNTTTIPRATRGARSAVDTKRNRPVAVARNGYWVARKWNTATKTQKAPKKAGRMTSTKSMNLDCEVNATPNASRTPRVGNRPIRTKVRRIATVTRLRRGRRARLTRII